MHTRRPLLLLLATASILLTGSRASSSDTLAGSFASPTDLSLEQILIELSSSRNTHAILSQNNFRRKEPVVVFVPGILGSRLSLLQNDQTEKVVWGCINNAIESSDDLNFVTSPELIASPLFGPLSSPDDCSYDIYHNFFTTMHTTAIAEKSAFLNFSYDWRQSNRHSAQDLDSFLKRHNTDLVGTDLVFIAHSMGGLLLKWWYHYIYLKDPGNYNFQVDRLYFVGTPHEGSYATIDALMNGYKLIGSSGTFLGWLSKKIFPALNDHGLSFPSFYELLPDATNDRRQAKFVPLSSSDPVYSIDFFNPDWWVALRWPDLGEVKLPPNIDSVDSFHKTYLPEMLRQAKAFREELAQVPSLEKARYVLSESHETPNSLVVKQENGQLMAELNVPESSGDGTVFSDSAKDSSKHVDTDHVKRLSRKHSNLLADENFIREILHLKSNYSKGWEGVAAEQWKTDEDIIGAFAERYALLLRNADKEDWPVLGRATFVCSYGAGYTEQLCSNVIEGESVSQPVDEPSVYVSMLQDHVGQFNSSVLAKIASDRAVPVSELSRELYVAAEHETDSLLRQRAYERYIAIERELIGGEEGNLSDLGWAFNKLGEGLLESGEQENAVLPLLNALSIGRNIAGSGELLDRARANLNNVESALR